MFTVSTSSRMLIIFGPDRTARRFNGSGGRPVPPTSMPTFRRLPAVGRLRQDLRPFGLDEIWNAVPGRTAGAYGYK